MVWMVITMVMVSAVGGAMVTFYSATTAGQQGALTADQARLMAESGRRFAVAEILKQDLYKYSTSAIAAERNKNNLLDSLSGNSFNVAANQDAQFKIDVTSYFYRASSDPGTGTTLNAQFIDKDNPGFTVPAASSEGRYLRFDGESTIYEYSSVSGPSGTGIYTFTLTQNAPSSVQRWTSVYPVVSSNFSGVSSGGTLSLDTGLGDYFPSENGMFLIEKEQIRANLPVATTVPYLYEYRSGDDLVNVTKGPDQNSFTAIDAGSPDYVEIAKFAEVDSTGTFGAQAEQAAGYHIAMHSSLSMPGLRSYYDFDDSGDPYADDYGIQDAEGGSPAPTYTTSAAVGAGALSFSGGAYLKTTFNPKAELGNNQSFSVVFWAKPDTVATAVQGVLGSLDAGKYFFIGIYSFSGTNYWMWGYGNDYQLIDEDPYFLPQVIENEWQHVAWVYEKSNGEIVLYLNGREMYRRPITGIGELSGIDIDIGGLYYGSDDHRYQYSGDLDELAFFNKALTFCEVQDIFNVASPPPCNDACDADLYYSFTGNANDESGTARDGDPGYYNGVVSGATLTTDQCGVDDQAYSFDGGDRIDTDYNPLTIIGSGNPFTVTLWASTTQTSALRAPFGSFDVTQSQRFYLAVYNGFWIWGYGNKNSWSDFTTRPSATANVWTHLGFVYDDTAGEVRLYVNGSETVYDYAGVAGDGIMPNLPAYVGARNIDTGTDSQFTGNVDEVIVWSEAKTADFIQELYNDTAP